MKDKVDQFQGVEKKMKEGDKYKAFQLTKPKQLKPVRVSFPAPEGIKPGQALIKFEAATICGTDMPKWDGREWSDFPAKPGLPLHECVGQVVFSNSPELIPGSQVLAMPLEDLGLQEYFVTDASQAITLTEDIVPIAGALIQPLSTVIYGVERLGDVRSKKTLVIGLGALGHLVAWLLKRNGAIVSTVDPVKSKLHDEWGFETHYTLSSHELTAQDIGGEADIVVEVVGHQEDTVKDAIRLTKRRGALLLMGVPRPGAIFEIETQYRKNLNVIASITPPWREYFPQALELMRTHQDQLKKLVTDQYAFDDAPKAYELYQGRENGRLKVAITN